MADILRFRPRTRPDPAKRALCQSGFHKWAVVDTPFDVRRGRLVTRQRCTRCGAEKTEAR